MMMPNGKLPIRKIISGGQTGVDRAALDVGLSFSIPIGGWCPKGRLAEDGPIPLFYPLQETPSSQFSQRTEWNVRDSDGTFVLTDDTPTGGTALTIRLAKHHHKPYLILNVDQRSDPTVVSSWLIQHDIRTLNIAGPRESTSPGIYESAYAFLHTFVHQYEEKYTSRSRSEISDRDEGMLV